jgi:hypothetical protein
MVWSETEKRLKRLCGRPSPVKRLVAVLVTGGLFAAANIYFVVSSIYQIGKNDTENELLKMQHIERLELPESQLKINNDELKIDNDEFE